MNHASDAAWILCFDGGCAACNKLARSVTELSDGRLNARSMRDEQVKWWREQALGPDSPWVPTLILVEGSTVRAWTGGAMALRLALLVGPTRTWRVLKLVESWSREENVASVVKRRDIVVSGLKGVTVGFSIIFGHRTSAADRALAQTVDAAGTRARPGEGRPKKGFWLIDDVPRDRLDRMVQSARGDRSFELIRGYFEDSGKWGIERRVALRLFKGERFIRQTYATFYRNRENDSSASVNYRVESGGKIVSYGYVYDGQGERRDDVWVQNGNVRTERRGRISPADFTVAAYEDDPPDCAIGSAADTLVGRGTRYGACGVVGGVAGILCSKTPGGFYGGLACGAAVGGLCYEESSGENICSGNPDYVCNGRPIYCGITPHPVCFDGYPNENLECSFGTPA